MPTEAALLKVLNVLTGTRKEVLERLTPEEADPALELQQVMASPNAVGAGIAEKISRGKPTGRLAVVVYVVKKKKLKRLAASEAVPPAADLALTRGQAVEFDVIEIGKVVPETNVTRKPMQPGYSIGHVKVTAGTLGAVVTRGRSYQVLSNSHVLADSGRGKRRDTILYPGKADGGKPPKDAAATLTRFKPFAKGGAFVNRVDAAIAAPLKARLRDLRADIKGLGLPRGEASAKRGMKVVKVGRTTGKTTGTVRDVNFRIKINYGAGVGVIGFRDQVLCTRYTKGGDSGSLVLDAKSKRAVGLHFAGSPTSSVFNPFDQVRKALRIKLVTKPIRPQAKGAPRGRKR